MGPGINNQLLMFNVLKILFQPLLKIIYGEIIKSDDYEDSSKMDRLFVSFMEKLFSDVNLEFTTECLAIIKDPNKSLKEKLDVLPKIDEKFRDYTTEEAADYLSEQAYKKMFEIKGKGFDDPYVKALFTAYKAILASGDIIQFAFQYDYNGVGFSMTQGLDRFEPDPICTPAEAIDLGLTSGTLWASYNVGATTSTELGDTFAWGEIEPKKIGELLGETFTTYELWDSYKWCIEGTYQTVTKYHSKDNKRILDLEDDAARYKWGGSWRMPTFDELKELLDECDSEWVPNHGVSGWWLTGPNGNKIFLTNGVYWTSELAAQNKGFLLEATSNGLDWSVNDRPLTYYVRPVRAKE